MQKCKLAILIGLIMILVAPIASYDSVFYHQIIEDDDRMLLNEQLKLRDGIVESKAIELMSSYFISNVGQIPESDHYFYSRGGDIQFLPDGVLMRFREIEPINDEGIENDPLIDLLSDHGIDREYNDKGVVLKYEFENANSVIPIGKSRCSWNTNYFIGNDPDNWHTDVANYNEIVYEEVWDGIDMIYKSVDGNLKYDIVVSPGADPTQIQINIEGSQGIKVDNSKDLLIETEYWDIMDTGLISFYEGNEDELIESKFELKDLDTIGFSLGEYDRSKCIIIDPLLHSTYIGGRGEDCGCGIEVDSSGNAYITGYTDDDTTDYPTTTGAYNTSHNGNEDVFITKLNSSGSSLIYSTFIGGSNNDGGWGGIDVGFSDIEIDTKGNAYVTGSTDSTNYPTTTGAYSISHNGGNYDVFVTKLNSLGSSLIYSTFIGGSNDEGGNDIEIDKSGNVYVTGYTSSTDYPTTYGAYDTSHNGNYDVFVTKLNSSGSTIKYSTFIGGSGSETGWGIAIDHGNNAFVTGNTSSTDYPTTSGAFARTYNGSGSLNKYGDAFITKLNSSGSSLNYSTFIGGSGWDLAFSIAVDSNGNAHITGGSEDHTTDFPTTTGAYDTTHNGGTHMMYNDVFVTKFNSNGSSLLYSTFIGGSGCDWGTGIAIDTNGNSYVTGSTVSTNFPVTSNAYDKSFNKNYDIFISKLDSSGSSLNYSTYIGGSTALSGSYPSDWPWEIAIDNKENVFITGRTTSTDYPTTSRAYDTSLNGNGDVFVTKLNLTVDLSPPFFGSDCSNTSATTGDPFCFSIEVNDNYDVSEVCVEYWYGNGSHINASVSGLDVYTLDINIASDSTDSLNYIFHAMDGSGNWNQTSKVKLTVTDNDAPSMGLDNSGSTPTTGDPFSFSMKVTDNIGLNGVFVEYWYGNGSHNNASMSGSSIFYHTITIPSKSFDKLRYIFHAVDSAGNWNVTDQFNKSILDNDGPIFLSDDSDTSAENGNSFTFSAIIIDNIELDEIQLEYWFGNNEHTDVGMNGIGPFTYVINIPMDSLDALHYIFHANDTSGNWNHTTRRDIPVIDSIIPVFVVDNSDKTATTGDFFQFSIDTTDNIGISKVYVEYWYGDLESTNVSMEGSGPYSNSTIIPSDMTDELHFEFHAVDISNNWAMTPRIDIPVMDNDPPVLGKDRTPYEVAIGDNLTFLMEVSDNLETSNVYLEYWLGTGDHINSSMEEKSGFYSFTLKTSIDSLNSVYYRIHAKDNSDNWAESLTKEVEMIDTIPPTASAGPDKTVDEGSLVKFDGSGCSDNIDIEIYKWTLKGRESNPMYGCVIEYLFKNPGVFIMILNVSDAAGNWHVDSVTVTVNDVTSPIANAGSEKTVNEGGKVIFDGIGSSDNVGIVNYTWTFEYDSEEIILYGFLPSFTFHIPGVYLTTLKVSDASGNFQEDTLNITVNDITPPKANAGTNQTVKAGTEVVLDGSLSTDNGMIISYSWTFHYDGVKQNLEGEIVSFTFEKAGVYDILLTVRDQFENAGEDPLKIIVEEADILDDGDEEPEESGGEGGFPALIIVILVVLLVLIIGVILFFVLRKKKENETSEEDQALNEIPPFT